MKPDYKQIYTDILNEKYPGKIEDEGISHKIDHIKNVMDVINLNTLIFGSKNRERENENQQLRAYDKNSILEILEFQRKNKINNSQLSIQFKISRNTITKWKKYFAETLDS